MKPNKTTEWSEGFSCIDVKTEKASSFKARKHIFESFDVGEFEIDSPSIAMFIPFRNGKMIGSCGFSRIDDAITEALKGGDAH